MTEWGTTDLDPATVTGILRDAGTLPTGHVTALTGRDTGAFNSRTLRVRLVYSDDAPPGPPVDVVIKRNTDAAWSIEAGAEEVRFYRALAALPDHPPVIPPCLGTGYDEGTGDSVVILADLTATHAPPVTRDQQISIVDGMPPDEHVHGVVDALADLHAYWWQPGPAARAAVADRWATGWDFDGYLARRTASWAAVRAQLPADAVALYDRLLARLPGYWNRDVRPRVEGRDHVTLIHGDAYLCNFLSPRWPGGRTYLLDWQSPDRDLAAYDLVNLFATFWSREQRQGDGGRERRLLRRWHERIVAAGVRGYAFDDLMRDYRHALIFWVLTPVQDAASGSRYEYWWPKMRCLIDAYADHGCDAMLG